MTSTYLFPPLLAILIGPHRSMCNNSRGRVVLTHFFDLKEDLTCLPFAQASHTLSSLNLMEGSPTTRCLETSLFRRDRLAWPSLLCQSIISSFKALKHSRCRIKGEATQKCLQSMYFHTSPKQPDLFECCKWWYNALAQETRSCKPYSFKQTCFQRLGCWTTFHQV